MKPPRPTHARSHRDSQRDSQQGSLNSAPLGSPLRALRSATRAVSNTPYLEGLYQVATADTNVLCVTCSEIARVHLESSPKRIPQGMIHLASGVSAAVSFCAGLASEGYKPILHASASALSRSGYEALLSQVAAPRLPVRVIGFDAGLSHPGGVSGQAIDDLRLLDLPNFTLADPGDAEEMTRGLSALNALDGPVYMRASQGQAPRLFEGELSVTEPRVLSEGSDILIISSGQCSAEVLRLSESLKRARVTVTHLHCFVIKPAPVNAILNRLRAEKYKGVITLEDHFARGGLGSAVAEIVSSEVTLEHRPPVHRLGLQDTFAQGGSHGYLFKKYGVDVGALIAAIEVILKRKIGIGTSELPPSPWRASGEAPPIR